MEFSTTHYINEHKISDLGGFLKNSQKISRAVKIEKFCLLKGPLLGDYAGAQEIKRYMDTRSLKIGKVGEKKLNIVAKLKKNEETSKTSQKKKNPYAIHFHNTCFYQSRKIPVFIKEKLS